MEGAQAPRSRKRGKKLILCDTNIVLDFYFKTEPMVKELDALGFERLAVSSITVGEMYFNMKVKERRKTRETINKFQIQPLTVEISDLFEQFMYKYHKFHPSVPDCLIAATSIVINAELFTFNKKHFTFYEGIKLYKPKYSHEASPRS